MLLLSLRGTNKSLKSLLNKYPWGRYFIRLENDDLYLFEEMPYRDSEFNWQLKHCITSENIVPKYLKVDSKLFEFLITKQDQRPFDIIHFLITHGEAKQFIKK